MDEANSCSKAAELSDELRKSYGTLDATSGLEWWNLR